MRLNSGIDSRIRLKFEIYAFETPFSMDAIHISEWFDYICDHYFAEFSFDRSQIEVQWSHNMVW